MKELCLILGFVLAMRFAMVKILGNHLANYKITHPLTFEFDGIFAIYD